MKKINLLFISFSSYLFFAPKAFAVDNGICPSNSAFTPLCDLSFDGGILGKLISFMFVLAAIIALFYLIYGGIKWIISEGDKEKVSTARRHIIAALLGLIVVFLSYFLLNLVLQLFIGVGISELELPTL
ncbi:pilin [Patescibacteria group bacterium]|nr:pilin [Patescibacteria group bacterium]